MDVLTVVDVLTAVLTAVDVLTAELGMAKYTLGGNAHDHTADAALTGLQQTNSRASIDHEGGTQVGLAGR